MISECSIECWLKMKKHHVCIYGVGKNGLLAIDILNYVGIEIDAVCDRKQGIVAGRQTLSFKDFTSLDSEKVCIVTPTIGAETERVQLEEHFLTVVGMEIFGNYNEIHQLREYIPCRMDGWGYESYFPFNHYESPYILPDSIEFSYYQLKQKKVPMGIDLNENQQLKLWKKLDPFYMDFYRDIKTDMFNRYHLNNGMFDEADATLYYGMLRLFKPKRVVEIGSGHSTALLLDVRENYLKEVEIICIEPYPERLMKNMKGEEVKLYKKYVQEVDLQLYDKLQEGDMLFIDSSHVAKMGGDVPFEYFEILPRLKAGVMIHIHDIFYPFDYPEAWIRQGRCYNEAFILRALLMDSNKYEVLFFNDMMYKSHAEDYAKKCKNPGGVAFG